MQNMSRLHSLKAFEKKNAVFTVSSIIHLGKKKNSNH